MTLKRKPSPAAWAAPGAFLAWSAVFALAYAQSPLYTSNQNQYFLHGLARAGLGALSHDWLAGTADPTPLFSLLVQAGHALAPGGWIFYAGYALLMGVYLFSMFGLMDQLFDLRSSKTASLLFVSLFLAAHSAAVRYLLSRLLGPQAAFLLEGGVAGQRLLGQVFQPSTFAVFLLLSLYLFLAGRRTLAILPLALAVSVHPTYLLGGALLTLAYLWVLWRESGSLGPPLRYGAGMLAAVAPILVYTLLNFRPTSAGAYAEAQDLLVNFRIPPHAILANWLDWTVAVKLLLIGLALVLVRRRPLFPVLAGVAAGALVLTLLTAALGSQTLALLFPWRISVVLVPTALACVLAAGVTRALAKWPPGERAAAWLRGLSVAGLGLLVILGLVRFQLESLRYRADPARPLIEFVAAHGTQEDIYLVPVKFGTFRLLAGAPIYVDFLAIPYRDVEVLEWYQRWRRASWFYEGAGDPCSELETFASTGGVTRVVLPVGHLAARCEGLTLLYDDEAYWLYALKP